MHLKIKSQQSSEFELNLIALVIKNITGIPPSSRCHPENWPHISHLQLADSTYHLPGKIDLLLGSDAFTYIIMPGLVKGPQGTPIAQATVFGLVISGPVQSDSHYNAFESHIQTFHTCIDIDRRLQQFWELEEESAKKQHLTKEETQCEDHYLTKHQRNSEGRYVVRLPLKSHELGKSRTIAERRFMQVKRRFLNNTNLKKAYIEFMEDYIRLNHMKLARDIPNMTKNRNFIPHNAVFKEESSTSKIRVVFDALAKTGNGLSLNDILSVGPTIQNELSSIIHHFHSRRRENV